MELARARMGVAERPVVELGWKARHDCPGRLPPEAEELESEDLSRLLVSVAVTGDPVEAHRLTPDDTARTSVRARPTERFEPARDHGDVLLHRDRKRAGVHLSRVAEPLPCPLDEDADDVSLADKLPRLAYPVPVALATADREPACPGERLPDDRDREELRLRHVPDRPVRERADERRIDRGEVVQGEHRASRLREAVEPVAVRARREPHRRDRDDVEAHEHPTLLDVGPPQPGNAKARQEHRHVPGRPRGTGPASVRYSR